MQDWYFFEEFIRSLSRLSDIGRLLPKAGSSVFSDIRETKMCRKALTKSAKHAKINNPPI